MGVPQEDVLSPLHVTLPYLVQKASDSHPPLHYSRLLSHNHSTSLSMLSQFLSVVLCCVPQTWVTQLSELYSTPIHSKQAFMVTFWGDLNILLSSGVVIRLSSSTACGVRVLDTNLVQLRGGVSTCLNETIQNIHGDNIDINTSSLLKA